MGKEAKTNAMRMLDRKKIGYEAITYECDEFIDGMHTAELTGAPIEASYKTLVTVGKSGTHYVAVIPIAEEIDFKKMARVAGEKSMSMISVKELLPLTGYVRGGCSPIGMKKAFRTFVASEAEVLSEIYVSGGRVGLTLKLPTNALMEVCGGEFAELLESR